jgi:propanediol utilization protein
MHRARLMGKPPAVNNEKMGENAKMLPPLKTLDPISFLKTDAKPMAGFRPPVRGSGGTEIGGIQGFSGG